MYYIGTWHGPLGKTCRLRPAAHDAHGANAFLLGRPVVPFTFFWALGSRINETNQKKYPYYRMVAGLPSLFFENRVPEGIILRFALKTEQINGMTKGQAMRCL